MRRALLLGAADTFCRRRREASVLQHRPRIHAGKEGGADGTKRCQRDGHVHNKHQRAVFEDELLKALRHEAKGRGRVGERVSEWSRNGQ